MPHPSTRQVVIWSAVVAAATAASEWLMGRLPLGPDGRFAWWESDIWSASMSQRAADPYSFSHVLHGVLFYGVLWLVARRLPLRTRALVAVLLEAAWEVLENSPIVINRYREVTMALGYEGDSILNSVSDILMMAAGFLYSARAPVWASLALLVVLELGMLVTIRDNLALNILMLLSPIDAIRDWQMAGR